MKLFEGKSPEERNKTIAAIVLGVLAFTAITWGIILPMFSSKKKTVRVDVNTTPTPATVVVSDSPGNNVPVAPLPNQEEIDFQYTTTPVVYGIGGFSAPPPGRNIFAFYEPPKPTPYSPTPTPTPKPPTPATPTPEPDYFIAYATPQSVFAGSDGFRLEVNGLRFNKDSVILFNGSQLPTNFISSEGLVAQIPGNLIANAGQMQISVVSLDGKSSNLISLNVQEPPKPDFQYIGMISRKRNNNDTAYFQEDGNDKEPTSARLNDVVAGRFRLKSISAEEVIFEDVTLGFRHKLALYRPEPGEGGSRGNYVPYNPNNRNVRNSRGNRNNTRINSQPRTDNQQQMTDPTTNPTTVIQPQINTNQPSKIPGIPDDIPRYNPTPQPNQKKP